MSGPGAMLPVRAAGSETTYRWLVLVNVMIGTFMAVLDATIVNVGLASIMAAFGAGVDSVEWVITGYMLSSTIMLPASGWFADRFGYKKVYAFALALFTGGSLMCGLSWSEQALIFFRIVQGLGAGFIMPVGMAIATREFPAEQRGMVLGFWGIAAAASISLGPMLGGYLIDTLGWRTIFTVNVPVGAFGILVTLAVQREIRGKVFRRLDVPGFVTMTLFLGALLLALSAGNAQWNTGGWQSTYVLTCFVVSFVSLVAFLVRELTTEHPLIELRLFRDFNFATTNVILFIFGVGMFGSTFLMPLYLQNSLGYTALQTGLLFLPVGLLQGLLSPVAGLLSDRIDARIPAIFGVTVLGLSLAMNSLLTLDTEHGWIVRLLLLRGVGAGFAFTPLGALSLRNIAKDKMAQASGLFNVIRQVGGSVGIAFLGAIETQRVIFHTAMYGQAIDAGSPVVRSTLAALQNHLMRDAGSTASTAAAQARGLLLGHVANMAFVQAVDDCFLLAGIITLVGTVPVLVLRSRKRAAIEALGADGAAAAAPRAAAQAVEEPEPPAAAAMAAE